MRRKGMLLLDGLMALFLLSALAVMMAPLAGEWFSAMERGRVGTKLSETGLFAMDFMVEKIRNNRKTMAGVVKGNRYDYQAVTGEGIDDTYRFFVDREKLKLQLYNDTIQPVTGEYTGPEAYAFLPGKKSLFHQEGGGPVVISFTMHHQMKRLDRDFETSVIPYADFYGKGKVYE
jgi:hypothetical protein